MKIYNHLEAHAQSRYIKFHDCECKLFFAYLYVEEHISMCTGN